MPLSIRSVSRAVELVLLPSDTNTLAGLRNAKLLPEKGWSLAEKGLLGPMLLTHCPMADVAARQAEIKKPAGILAPVRVFYRQFGPGLESSGSVPLILPENDHS